jgi:hypothetical protein
MRTRDTHSSMYKYYKTIHSHTNKQKNITGQDHTTKSHIYAVSVRAHMNILCTFYLSLNIL